MFWCLPRSDPGATTEYRRPNGCGVSTERGKLLPYGRFARLVLLWLYAEVLRTGSQAADLGYSFCDYLFALRVHDELDLPGTEYARRGVALRPGQSRSAASVSSS